jgi:CHAT domain-containing protein
MGAFYRGLRAGKGKASALRAAALALKNDGTHGHPGYWAAFMLMGEGR